MQEWTGEVWLQVEGQGANHQQKLGERPRIVSSSEPPEGTDPADTFI